MTANSCPIVENFAAKNESSAVANPQSTLAKLCGKKHPETALFDMGIRTKIDFLATTQHPSAVGRSREVCACAQAFIGIFRSYSL